MLLLLVYALVQVFILLQDYWLSLELSFFELWLPTWLWLFYVFTTGYIKFVVRVELARALHAILSSEMKKEL